MDKQHIIQFIDNWLDENGWKADSRVADFALDVRLMLEQLGTDQRERLVGSSV